MKQLFLEQDNLNTKFTALVIFLYPIAGVGLNHWFSGFATLLVFSGLYILVSNFHNSTSTFGDFSLDEKLMLFFVAFIFFAFVISGFVNGWNHNQLKYFFGEMNFLFFVPLYLAVRKVKNAPEILVKATVLAGVVLVFTYIPDVLLSTALNKHNNIGAAGKLVAGPVSVMFMYLVMSSYREILTNKYWLILYCFSIIFSFMMALAAKSGTGYVLLAGMSIIVPLFLVKKLFWRLAIVIGLISILLASYNFSSEIKGATHRVIDGQFSLSSDDMIKEKELGTAGLRIILGLVSWEIFKDNPVFGVGRGNFTDAATVYYKKGEASHFVTGYAHPHSIYFELLVSKGLLGFGAFVLWIFFTFKLYLRAKKNKLAYTNAAFIHILSILIIGLALEGPVIKNNYTTLFLVYLAVFYSTFSQQLTKTENKG